jgi:hypothetical protein
VGVATMLQQNLLLEGFLLMQRIQKPAVRRSVTLWPVAHMSKSQKNRKKGPRHQRQAEALQFLKQNDSVSCGMS